MNRFNKLINELTISYPDDWWLKCNQLLPEVDDMNIMSSKIAIYDQALNSLEKTAWHALKEKIFNLFEHDRPFRGKQAFFDQLNEAFAYEFLNNLGYSKIEFIPESKEKTADISFELNNETGLCEVKTINCSDEESNRHKQGRIFSSQIYKNLDAGFFNKLKSDIDNSTEKFYSSSCKNIIYFIIHFDDSTEMFYPTYKQQIIDFVCLHYPKDEFYFQIGLDEKKAIHLRESRVQPT